MSQNLLLKTDSYKFTHHLMYPPGTTCVRSYLESRGGFFDNTVFFGLQYYLKEYLSGLVFKASDIQEASVFANAHFGNPRIFNHKGWTDLYTKYQGRLPVRIKAVKEGSVIPIHNVLMTIENTDPDFPWLTNYLETLLLKVWYPITVCTLSREIKKVIGKALHRTGTPSLLPFKLHDFGYRGVSSEETAAIGGAAHLVNFQGTDTIAGITFLSEYYDSESMPGYSIPATEHSTITIWGESRECVAYENLLNVYPEGMVACVSDSWDVERAVREYWGDTLREKIMQRNGTLVIRPDSGDPVKVLSKVFNIIAERFGSEVNSKGWRVFPSCVRVIQGDGVNYHSILNMVSQLTREGWSMDNWGFGMGGALLQQLNRDTQNFAIKCSSATINGRDVDVSKKPTTDPSKASKPGRLALLSMGNGRYSTVPVPNGHEYLPGDLLETVFEDGDIKLTYNLGEIRRRADISEAELQ